MFELPFPLLAQSDWNSLAGRLRPDPRTDWSQLAWLGGGLVALIVLFVLAQMIAKWRKQQAAYSPWGLFRQLCRVHQLTWSEGWLLRQLAWQQRLTQPAAMFVDPTRLNETRLAQLSQRQQLRAKELRRKLFSN